MFKIFGIIFIILLFLSFLRPETREYLNEHIQAIFLKEAKERVKEKKIIGSTDVYSPRVEEIQSTLKEIGFFEGPIDGLMGGATRRAIKKFQKNKNLQPTGIINKDTYSLLLREKENQIALKSLKQTQAVILEKEIPFVLEKPKKEIHKSVDLQKEDSLIPGEEKIKQIQSALKKAGFDPGPIDGKIGKKTKKAIRQFQKANGLKADGIVGKLTWVKLKKYLK